MLIDISPLKVSRDYRLLFFGQLISTFGTAMSFVVLPVQVYQLTGSTLLVGLLSASEFVLILLMAFVGGAYADFIDKRKMLRLTETRGVREWPASFQASRKARICLACWMWNGSPVSSNLRVEDWRFIPSWAAQTAVALEAAPHQIRSRSPSECGSRRNSPGGLGNIGRGFG